MKKYRFWFWISALLLPLFLLTAFKGNTLFRINQSFEIFAAVYKQVLDNYVLDIDPEILMKNGIDGMLASLDPYTVYYSNEEVEDIDFITAGRYVGFGISVRNVDGMITIMEIRKGYSAQEEGVKVGDVIYSIDGEEVQFLSSDDLRFFTRGAVNTQSQLRILRNDNLDTLDILLTRQLIQIDNVSYAGLIDGNVGYIKLEHFNRNAANEVRNSLQDLKSQTELKGLILDLRDNPGGLLDAAIAICEIFVPRGSTIVSTRGKLESTAMIFRSISNPSDTLIPLAVLINEGSASASEVVAGAIQDLDRGIIIGNRSFGKGLVQSVFELPFNNTLKITTAKYYTPSGRCIQRIDYSDVNNDQLVKENPDTNLFYTLNNRVVRESTGIIPDSTINFPDLSDVAIDLLENNIIFKFVNQGDNIESNQSRNDRFNKFQSYLKQQNYIYEPEEVFGLKEIYSSEIHDNYNEDVKNKFNDLISSMTKNPTDIEQCCIEEINLLLELEIARKSLDNSILFNKIFEFDEVIRSAYGMINNDSYRRILANQTTKDTKPESNQ